MAREITSASAPKASSMRFDDESDDDDGVAKAGQSSKAVAKPRNQPKDTSKLFVKDYIPIRFYILENDVRRSVVEELEELIRDCGGEVVHKPPPEGYILVDPRTEDGVDCISRSSTPTKRVVSFQFVKESVIRGRLVPYLDLILFIKQDKPVKFHLHESLSDLESNRLWDAILLGGGNPDANLDDADVLIHASGWGDKNSVARKHKNIVIFETPKWLDACISRKRFSLTDRVGKIPQQKERARPGRKPGAPRTEFTEKDDEYLIAWMARVFGTTTAGRAGNRPYQDLVEDPRYTTWAQRHTWHSWRERYKNRKAHFDPLIAAHAAKYKNKNKDPSPEIVFPSSEADADPEDNGPPPDRELRSKRKTQDTSGVLCEQCGSQATSSQDARPKKKAKVVSASDEDDDEDFRIKISASQRSPRSNSHHPSSASPPPADEIAPQPEPEHSGSARSNDGNLSDSQDESIPNVPILDAAISNLDAQGVLDRHKAELAAFQTQPTDGEEPDEEEPEGDEEDFDDPDVDVEGVTQAEPPFQPIPFDSQDQSNDDDDELDETPDDADETEIESIEVQLAQIADEFSEELDHVKSLYDQAIASGRNEREALEWTRRHFKQPKSSKKGKGRAK